MRSRRKIHKSADIGREREGKSKLFGTSSFRKDKPLTIALTFFESPDYKESPALKRQFPLQQTKSTKGKLDTKDNTK